MEDEGSRVVMQDQRDYADAEIFDRLTLCDEYMDRERRSKDSLAA